MLNASDRILETANIMACIRFIDRFPGELKELRSVAYSKLNLEESKEIVKYFLQDGKNCSPNIKLKAEAFKILALGKK